MISNQKSNHAGWEADDLAPSERRVREQMDLILASEDFQATNAQRKFLRFVVDKTLVGESDEIKGYTVATNVFGRGQDFDQATDPIVSIHANKLRRALERYYLTAGLPDSIRIDIPKGGYVPIFQNRESGPPLSQATMADGGQEETWPTVLIRPFRNLTGDPGLDHVALGMVGELAVELGRHQDILVFMDSLGQSGSGSAQARERFFIDGWVKSDGETIRLNVYLTDAKTGSQIWGDTLESRLEAARMMTFQEESARAIAAEITAERGAISRTMATESRARPPLETTTYEAILRYYEFDMTYTREAFFKALTALQNAVAKEPMCGQVWTMLARLYIVNYNLEQFEMDTPLEQASIFAQKGVSIDPGNRRARCVLAFVKMIAGDLMGALAETERALVLSQHSLVYLDIIGYMLTLLGQWERGTAMLRKAMKLNPNYMPMAHYGLWLDWFRRGEYEKAYAEVGAIGMLGLHWGSLARAATLGQWGKITEGRKAADELIKLKPDFATRGRTLIGYYIKFPELVALVAAGLSNVGLEIE